MWHESREQGGDALTHLLRVGLIGSPLEQFTCALLPGIGAMDTYRPVRAMRPFSPLREKASGPPILVS